MANSNYASAVLDDTPVGYWRMQETSGTTAADSSGNARDGTYSSAGVTLNQTPTAVVNDVSVYMNGSTSDIQTPISSGGMSAISIEFWVDPTSLSGSPRFIADGHTDASHTGFQIYWQDGNNWIRLDLGVANTLYSIKTPVYSASTESNVWSHVVFTWDGANLAAYINGSQVSTGTTASGSTITSSGYNIAVGYNPVYSGDHYTGYMQEVAIYNKALTASQVQNHYNAATQSGGGSTNVEGTASFSGSSSLSATANVKPAPNVQGSVAFTGGSTLSATSDTVQKLVEGTASFDGTSSLSATADEVTPGNVEVSASFAGQSDVSATSDTIPAPNVESSGAFTGNGSLSATSSTSGNQAEGDAAFSGGSDLSANADVQPAPNVDASANITGDGTLSAQAQTRQDVSASFSGNGTMQADGYTPNEVHIPTVTLQASLDTTVSLSASLDNTVTLEGGLMATEGVNFDIDQYGTMAATFNISADLTGCTLVWQMQYNVNSPTPLIKKTSQTGGGIVINSTGADGSSFTITITNDDMTNISQGSYYHQAGVIDPENDADTIAKGTVTVNPAAKVSVA